MALFTIITLTAAAYTAISICASALICWAIYRFQSRPDPREVDPAAEYGDQGGDPLRQFVDATLHVGS